MSHPRHQPPPPYPVQPGQWASPPPAPRNRHWILIVVLATVALCLFGGAMVNMAGSHSSAGKTLATDTTTSGSEHTTTAGRKAPKPADFTLTPKITRKQCFGSAGCNVSLSVDVAYSGKALNDDDTWTITYSLTGGDSGPIIDQIDVTGSQYSSSTQTVSTSSSSTPISITATGVDKN